METSNMNFSDANKPGGGGLTDGRINTSGLKKPTNIRNDKEVEGEITRICETLKDTCKSQDSSKAVFILSQYTFLRIERLEFEIHLI